MIFLLLLLNLVNIFSKSCENVCGDSSWLWWCQCDIECLDRNDCCSNYIEVCNRPINLGIEDLYIINSYTNVDTYNGNIDKCGECGLIWVHGYNMDMNSAINRMKDVRESYTGNCVVYGFIWDSDWDLDFELDDLFGDKIELANKIGKGSFKDFIMDLKNECPNMKLTIAGHSLGTRIIFQALNFVSVNIAISISGAVDNDVIKSGYEFENITKNAIIYVAYNEEDLVLRSTYWTFRWFQEEALGKTGCEEVHSINFMSSWGNDHSGVYNKNKNKNFWRIYKDKIDFNNE